MSIFDAIKNSVLEQFSTTISVADILTSLIIAFISAVFIIVIYRKTFSGVVYNKSMALTIALLALITATVIRTINSNLTLSLGMVGALSIVRFRTAIKDPVDTAFLFWAIAAGIMSGAGLYIVAIISSLCVGLLFYLLYIYDIKAKAQYLMVIIFDQKAEDKVHDLIASLAKTKLKSSSSSKQPALVETEVVEDQPVETTTKTGAKRRSKPKTKTVTTQSEKIVMELTYEVQYDDSLVEVISKLQKVDGVETVNLVTYTNDYGL